MKSDGYIITPELLQWRYFHRPVVVQVLIHVLLSSTHNEASAATLSYRDLALQLHATVKAVRCAIDVLVAERIITKCTSPRSSTKLYINSSHPLSHCVIPWQNDIRAQATAQIGAQQGAQFSHLQHADNQGCKVYYQDGRGTDRGTATAHIRAQQKRGAQATAQIGAQISHSKTPLNKGVPEDFEPSKGTDEDTSKGTGVRGKKQRKENTSPETPIKENKQRKQKAPTQTPKKEKEKKLVDAEAQFLEVLRLFNRLFMGTQVKSISKMTPDRKKLVAKFISDYSYEDIEPMLRKALNSDLLSGRKDGDCYISFNWLFNPKNYEPLMEGTFDNPKVAASARKKASAMAQPTVSAPSPPSEPQRQLSYEESEALKTKLREDKEKADKEKLRQRYLDYIEASKDNPNGTMAKIVRQAYQDGTLANLGIVWNPSIEEENQSLLNLDDQTQSYLQSILSD